MDIDFLPPDEHDALPTTRKNAPPVEEDASLALGEQLSEVRIQNYLGIAEEHLTAEERADLRTELREEMRNRGIGDPMELLGTMLLGAQTVKTRAGWVHAAVTIRDEGRADRAVATIDQPARDPEAAPPVKKGKPKAAVSWVKAIGTNVLVIEDLEDIDELVVHAMLRADAFKALPQNIKAEPAYGWCQISDPFDVDFPLLPEVAGEFYLWGLRRDQKQGIPRTSLRMQAGRQALAEAKAEGKARADKARTTEIFEDLLARWFRESTPQTSVTPVTWHPEQGMILVHTSAPKVAAAAMDLLRRGLGSTLHSSRVVYEMRNTLEAKNPAATDLRKPNGVGEGAADIGADFLLWLVARAENGTGVLRLADEKRVEWWIADEVALERDTVDDKSLKVKLAGAPTEGGSFYAALADGSSLQSARIALRCDEQTYHVSLDGLHARAYGLPALCVPDGTPDSLDAAVVERIELWRFADRMVSALRAAFVEARTSSWSQLLQALRRRLGVEIVNAWGWNPATGQGLLFRDMIPASQEELFAEHNAETPSRPRGRGRKNREPAEA